MGDEGFTDRIWPAGSNLLTPTLPEMTVLIIKGQCEREY
jgi:hypothetical protein